MGDSGPWKRVESPTGPFEIRHYGSMSGYILEPRHRDFSPPPATLDSTRVPNSTQPLPPPPRPGCGTTPGSTPDLPPRRGSPALPLPSASSGCQPGLAVTDVGRGRRKATAMDKGRQLCEKRRAPNRGTGGRVNKEGEIGGDRVRGVGTPATEKARSRLLWTPGRGRGVPS